MDKIGIMGGTFDPIHLGHLAMAQEAADLLHLPQVVFIPAQIPPHKRGRRITPPETRLRMTKIATADNPLFAVSDMELKRSAARPSYTVDTLNELKALYGETTELYFISGADSLVDLPTWHRAEELLHRCFFVATRRPGVPLTEKIVADTFGALAERIIFLDTPALEISSTAIRERIKNRRSVRYYIPAAVAKFIENEGLYRE